VGSFKKRWLGRNFACTTVYTYLFSRGHKKPFKKLPSVAALSHYFRTAKSGGKVIGAFQATRPTAINGAAFSFSTYGTNPF
jgi:hypothetical protein